jgi:hypothetical protein
MARFTPKKKATFADSSFLHVTMEVDTVSTTRRYPQLVVSNVPFPISAQGTLSSGYAIVVQTFDGEAFPTEAQLEYCDHHDWVVNDQCPRYKLDQLGDGNAQFIAPRVELNGLQGQDRTVRFDVFASTHRVYLYLNGTPYGCGDLPSGFPTGDVTVTFGDALYHSGVDLGNANGPPYSSWYPFQHDHMQVFTSRHFSNLAFSSGIAEPKWDTNRMPCAPSSSLQ